MNTLDIFFIIILTWSAYKGFSNGLIYMVASILALILGIFGAIKFSYLLTNLLNKSFDINPENVEIIAFALTFIGIVIAIHLFAKVLKKLVESVALGFVNRIAGAVFGIFKTGIIISVILFILVELDKKSSFIPNEHTENSFLYKPLCKLAPKTLPFLKLSYDKVKETLEENNILKEE